MDNYHNPIIHADYSDPDVICAGNDFYMVASSFTYIPGVPILHSKDLVHWHIINYAVRSLPFDKYRKPSHGSGTWAPSIRYHEGTFYVFIPLVDEGIMVARSRDINGEFELNMLTHTSGWIDPCPLWDDDGRAYMFFAYAKSRCGLKHKLMMIEIDSECRKIIGKERLIFDGTQTAHTCEGPKAYKKDGWYYIFFPAGGVATGWQAAIRSKSLEGPFEYKILLNQGATAINGPHQGAWVTAPDGRDWFVHFQDVIELGRITHLQPMTFFQGWPYIGMDVNGDGIGEPVPEWDIPVENAPEYQIQTSDDFSSPELGLQWQWQANPDERNYSLTENPGHLRMRCIRNEEREPYLWYAPNALTQIPQSEEPVMTATLGLEGRENGDSASIGIIGHEYGYLSIYYDGAGYSLRLYGGHVSEITYEGKAKEEMILSKPLSSSRVHLRLKLGKDKMYKFSYSEDGRTYIPVGPAFRLERATWTGAKLCIWAVQKEGLVSSGYADFDSVDII